MAPEAKRSLDEPACRAPKRPKCLRPPPPNQLVRLAAVITAALPPAAAASAKPVLFSWQALNIANALLRTCPPSTSPAHLAATLWVTMKMTCCRKGECSLKGFLFFWPGQESNGRCPPNAAGVPKATRLARIVNVPPSDLLAAELAVCKAACWRLSPLELLRAAGD